LPVAAAQAVAAPAGRGRGKGKKGRGKKKGKFAMKKAPPAPALGEDGLPLPKKEKPLSLKAQVENEIGDRDIEEVIKEARAKVEEFQKAVSAAQQEELTFETDIITGKTKMSEASAHVDSCVHTETIALEKLKAAKRDMVAAQGAVAVKKLEFGDGDRAMRVLEDEGEMQAKTADLIQQKKAVQEAKEAAKKALMEANLKQMEIAQAMKDKRAALMLTDDPVAAARAKAETERAIQEDKDRKEAKTAGKHADSDLKAEMKTLDKMRAERDKERAKAFKEAAGLGSKKRASIGDGASPAKAAKIHDVD